MDYVMDTPSDYWCDVAAAFMDLGDGGCDFIDRVETEDKTERDPESIRREIEARLARLTG